MKAVSPGPSPQQGVPAPRGMSLRYRFVRKIGYLLRLRLEEPPGWFWRLAIDALAWIVRIQGWTLRYEVDDPPRYFSGGFKEPIIFLLWHNRMAAMPAFYERWRVRGRPRIFILTSASPEGSLLARFLSHFGIGPVRGSSSRRGSIALREMAQRIAEGHDILVTPDGPRGPRYRLQPGALYLAQLSGRPLLPSQIEYSRYLRFKSWDGLAIPLPFARVRVSFSEPCTIPRTLSADEFERERRRIEGVMTQSLLMDGPAGPR